MGVEDKIEFLGERAYDIEDEYGEYLSGLVSFARVVKYGENELRDTIYKEVEECYDKFMEDYELVQEVVTSTREVKRWKYKYE